MNKKVFTNLFSQFNSMDASYLPQIYLTKISIIKLSTGYIELYNDQNEKKTCHGPCLILLDKMQNLHYSYNIDDAKFFVIELHDNFIENFYQLLSNHHKTMPTEIMASSCNKIISVNLEPTTSEIIDGLSDFNILPSHRDNEHFGSVQAYYPMMYLLSFFIAPTGGTTFLERLARKKISEKVYSVIAQNIEHQHVIKTVAKELNMSSSNLKRQLKNENTTFGRINIGIRMNAALRLLRDKTYSIKQVGNMCGYDSTSYFCATFKKTFNITPLRFMMSEVIV